MDIFRRRHSICMFSRFFAEDEKYDHIDELRRVRSNTSITEKRRKVGWVSGIEWKKR